MILLSKIKIFSILSLALISAAPSNAQDLLARQAPIDRKMQKVDTLMMQNLTLRELLEMPAEDLYAEWDNEFFQRGKNLPDSFRIDLRGFVMPTVSRALTSNFGRRRGRPHEGLDLKVFVGDTIRSAFDGKVRMVRNQGARKGYGRYVVVRHPNGLETLYGHLSKQLVEENQEVKAGEPIGLGGNTGRSSGSHLHFETRLCGLPLNPVLMFDFRHQDVVSDFYTFNRNTYDYESLEATRIRGVVGNGAYTADMVRGTEVPEGPKYIPGTIKRTDEQPEIAAKYHKVKSGESLSTIAKKYHTTIDALCRLNRIKKTSTLRLGQILRYS